MASYQGQILQFLLPEGILEQGELVWCFQEDEHYFRVHTRRLVLGVDQVNFPVSSKDNFKVLWE